MAAFLSLFKNKILLPLVLTAEHLGLLQYFSPLRDIFSF